MIGLELINKINILVISSEKSKILFFKSFRVNVFWPEFILIIRDLGIVTVVDFGRIWPKLILDNEKDF